MAARTYKLILYPRPHITLWWDIISQAVNRFTPSCAHLGSSHPATLECSDSDLVWALISAWPTFCLKPCFSLRWETYVIFCPKWRLKAPVPREQEPLGPPASLPPLTTCIALRAAMSTRRRRCYRVSTAFASSVLTRACGRAASAPGRPSSAPSAGPSAWSPCGGWKPSSPISSWLLCRSLWTGKWES